MYMYEAAGKGLRLLFWSQIILLFKEIPIIGDWLSEISFFLTAYAFYTMAQSTSGYYTGFKIAIAQLVISVVLVFSVFAMPSPVLTIVTTGFQVMLLIVNLLLTYFICNSSGELLFGIDNKLAASAKTIWILYLICALVFLFCKVFNAISLFPFFTILITYIVLLVQFISKILFMIFIWKSQKVLLNYKG